MRTAAASDHQEINDDATVEDELEDIWSESDYQLGDTLKPAFNEDQLDELVFAAMRGASDFKKKPRCKACEGYHPADSCHSHGPEFQPPLLRKRIEQYNAKHGDKPKFPPVDRPRPRTASFALKGDRSRNERPCFDRPRVDRFALQQKAMSHALQDDVPNNGLSFRSMSICPEIKNDATLPASVKELPEPT